VTSEIGNLRETWRWGVPVWRDGGMAFPAAHRTKLRSVNPLERPNGGIKRHTDVVGAFPNGAALTWL
jgi:hypothetical protein